MAVSCWAYSRLSSSAVIVGSRGLVAGRGLRRVGRSAALVRSSAPVGEVVQQPTAGTRAMCRSRPASRVRDDSSLRDGLGRCPAAAQRLAGGADTVRTLREARDDSGLRSVADATPQLGADAVWTVGRAVGSGPLRPPTATPDHGRSAAGAALSAARADPGPRRLPRSSFGPGGSRPAVWLRCARSRRPFGPHQDDDRVQ